MSRVRALLLACNETTGYAYGDRPTVKTLEFRADVVVADEDAGTNLRYSAALWGEESSGIATPSDADLHAFALRFWVSDDFESLSPYGLAYAYLGASEVDLDRAERMAKTLRRVAGFLDRKRRTDGYTESPGQYVARVAQAIKATHMLRAQDPGLYGPYRVMGLGDGADWITRRVATWQDGVRARRAQTVEVGV